MNKRIAKKNLASRRGLESFLRSVERAQVSSTLVTVSQESRTRAGSDVRS